MSKIMRFAEFCKIAKVGMRVKADNSSCGEIHKVGTIDDRVRVVDGVLFLKIDGCYHEETEEWSIELLDDPETIEEGMVLVDEWGNERAVLGVVGTNTPVYAISQIANHLRHEFWYSLEDLIESSWAIKPTTPEPTEPEIKELTMDEVAKLAGVPVEQLRIRKEGK